MASGNGLISLRTWLVGSASSVEKDGIIICALTSRRICGRRKRSGDL
ncbi:Myb-like DNA-binding domain [Musa troglodytarum]|uniref:Myb-like DNA-binding domain n=1 Tax=Musa troglodytarum TaxID=320322 RepID=A0A9E7L2V8_9LILI|nr:Myb-like DNA-binding domain [Musa troglodytarum]